MEQVSEKVLKQREYSKAYRERNREVNRERDRLKAAKKREGNRDAYNAYMREWLAKNKTRVNAERRERLVLDLDYAEKVRARDRDSYAANPEKHRSTRLKSVYGITIVEYKEMYENQGGKCAICGTHKPNSGRGGLQVDHCHISNKVRELLCVPCNTAIGKMKDDVNVLRKAIEYIEKHNKE